MQAACSPAGRHTGRPGCLLSLLLTNNHHMHTKPGTHTKLGTYTSPRMREQRVRTPARESAEKGMFLGETAGGRSRRRVEGKPGGLPPRQTIITKMGMEIFKDAVAAPSTEL